LIDSIGTTVVSQPEESGAPADARATRDISGGNTNAMKSRARAVIRTVAAMV
jgi:hypothetical protein